MYLAPSMENMAFSPTWLQVLQLFGRLWHLSEHQDGTVSVFHENPNDSVVQKILTHVLSNACSKCLALAKPRPRLLVWIGPYVYGWIVWNVACPAVCLRPYWTCKWGDDISCRFQATSAAFQRCSTGCKQFECWLCPPNKIHLWWRIGQGTLNSSR